MNSPPACQLYPDKRKDSKIKCQGVLIDRSGKNVLIVYEKVTEEDLKLWGDAEGMKPSDLQRWGFPKGKFKQGERLGGCVHREVCEEVGINVSKYPHVYHQIGTNQIITFNRDAHDIKLHVGPEIEKARWVNIDWLKKDVNRDIYTRRNDPNYIPRYNRALKNIVFKI